MRRSYANYYKALDRVTNLVELLISCHPQGFGVLLGDVDAPDSLMIHTMMNAGRVAMPDDFKPTNRSNETEAERIVYDRDYFDESVKMADGWPHIHLVSKEFKEADSRMWSIVMDHVKFVSNPSSRYMSKLGYVASRYSLSPRTVTKYRKEFPMKLAYMILMPEAEKDKFYLLPG